jgi:ankyrin repeat protein
VNAADYEGETALIHAVQCLDGPVEEMVSLLLRHGANINAVSTMGHSPLIQALAWRNRRAVVALLSYGPDLGIATPDSETATTYAIARWDVEMVRMLLDAGANPNWTTADGGTLLGEALCPLNRRADYSERQIVRLLLEHGADPDQVDVDRGTPLMMAVRTDDPVLLATILAWTKNVNCRDEKEKTALTIARERGMTEIIALLRQAGAIE